MSKPKSQKAQAKQGIQEITVTVDGGYEPSYVVVNAGQRVRLNFLRRDPSSCLEEVRLPDFHIAKDLPLNQVTPIEFVPDKPGTYTYYLWYEYVSGSHRSATCKLCFNCF